MRILAEELRFPEGPIALSDGSVVLVEIAGGRITRVTPEGEVQVIAAPGGGPNGAAVGPDGRIYVCNNGGMPWADEAAHHGLLLPDFAETGDAHYSGGRIEAVDLRDGTVEELYRACDGRPLSAPNDIVFDAHGGFYFTDLGVIGPRNMVRGGVHYATIDGRSIREVAFPGLTPNGVGLSPDGTRLYSTETLATRLIAWDVIGPGELANRSLLYAMPAERTGPGGHAIFDSLAVEAGGNVCIATPFGRGITVISPDGELVEEVDVPAPMATNICFGGPELRTAYITAGGGKQLLQAAWPRPGLRLAFNA